MNQQELEQKINKLTNLQTRILISKILGELDETQNEDQIPQPLLDERSYWDEVEQQYNTDDITATMNVAANHYDIPLLGANSPFANYVRNFAPSNAQQCVRIMQKFCQCLCLASLKPEEQQKIFFESFPPSGEYIKCLDGTEERLEQLERELASTEKQTPFLTAHEKVMRNEVGFLMANVAKGNEVHIPKYLEYSLGLRPDRVIHPQSQIPFWKASRIHRNYAKNFKIHFRNEVLGAVSERRNAIQTAVQHLRETFSDVNFNSFTPTATQLSSINASLQQFEDGTGFLVENEDGTARLDTALLEEAAFNIPAIKFLDEMAARQEFQELSAEAPNPHNTEIMHRLRSDVKNFFTEKASLDLALIISQPTNHEELFFALENLWMLGEMLASGSQHNFHLTNLIIQSTYLDHLANVIRPKIQRFLPYQIEKIDRIQARLGTTQHADPNSSLSHMLYCNAPIELIAQKITNTDVNTLNHALENLSFEICEQLILRPDATEILTKIRDRLLTTEPNQYFTGFCLAAAAKNNDSDLCGFLFNHFVKNVTAFNNNPIFHHFAEHNNTAHLQQFATYVISQGHPELLHLFLNNETPMMTAARAGSIAFIHKLHQAAGAQNSGINDVNTNGLGVAHVAGRYGQTNTLRTLARRNINLFALDAFGNNAVYYAAHYDQPTAIETLQEIAEQRLHLSAQEVLGHFNHVNPDGHTPLFTAVHKGNKESVLALAKAGVTGAEIMNHDFEGGNRLVHAAVMWGKADLVPTLCELGANPNLVNNQGQTPLSLALDQDNVNAVEQLYRAGVDLNQVNTGRTLIYRLALEGKLQAIQTLVDAGANIDHQVGYEKYTAIHHAIKDNRPGLIPILCNYGAKITYSHIALALRYNNLEAITELAGVGADLNHTLFIEALNHNEHHARLLLQAGANPNHIFSNGNSFLHEVVRIGTENPNKRNSRAFLILMKLGVGLDIRDANGNTADYLAINEGLTSVAAALSPQRFDFLMREAIEKNNNNVVKKLIFFAKNVPQQKEMLLSNITTYLQNSRSKDNEELAKLIDDESRKWLSAAVATTQPVNHTTQPVNHTTHPPLPPSTAPVNIGTSTTLANDNKDKTHE
ncbi:MAG: hypothetical protein FJX34_00945 [Alphaproteobacteria bacterium]|nr:hypothetical protein [Alphaproteobacteria bacterium]